MLRAPEPGLPLAPLPHAVDDELLERADVGGEGVDLDEPMEEGDVGELLPPEEDGVLPPEHGGVDLVARVAGDAGAGEGGEELAHGGLPPRDAPEKGRRLPALGAKHAAHALVHLRRRHRQRAPRLVPRVKVVLPKLIEEGGPGGEERRDGAGVDEPLELGGEEEGEDVADVLGEGEGEEGGVLAHERGHALGARGEDGVHPAVDGAARGERGPLDAARVEAQEGAQQDVDEGGDRG